MEAEKHLPRTEEAAQKEAKQLQDHKKYLEEHGLDEEYEEYEELNRRRYYGRGGSPTIGTVFGGDDQVQHTLDVCYSTTVYNLFTF